MPKGPYQKKSVRVFAETLRPQLRGMAVGLCTVSRMAEVLNILGVPGPKGGKWHPTMVSRVISRLPGFEEEVWAERKKFDAERAKQNPAFSQQVSVGLKNVNATFKAMNQ